MMLTVRRVDIVSMSAAVGVLIALAKLDKRAVVYPMIEKNRIFVTGDKESREEKKG